MVPTTPAGSVSYQGSRKQRKGAHREQPLFARRRPAGSRHRSVPRGSRSSRPRGRGPARYVVHLLPLQALWRDPHLRGGKRGEGAGARVAPVAGGGGGGQRRSLIQPSAWEVNSPKFGVNERGLDSRRGLVAIRTWGRQHPK